MRRVEASYAEALLALAETPKEARAFGAVLDDCAGAFETSDLLRRVLGNTALPRAFKKDVLTRIAPKNAPEMALNCVRLLVDKGHAGLFPRLAREYRRRLAEREGIVTVCVYTAEPLSEEEGRRICAYFSRKHGGGTRLETVLDPALIGGIRVQVGDHLYDQSLFGRLQGLGRAVAEQLHNN